MRTQNGKSRGLMTLMAGFMLVAIAQSKNLFGWNYKNSL